MTGAFATSIIFFSLALAAWSVVLVIVNWTPHPPLIVAAFLLEAMLVIFAVGGIVQMSRTDTDFARAEFVGYLLACVAIVPAAIWWMKDEKTRAASGVLAVVFLVVPFMILRVQLVWLGTNG